MSRLRLVFILSLVILAGVFIATIYLIPGDYRGEETKRVQVIQGENEWILQYDIINPGERHVSYTIHVTVDDKDYSDRTVVKAGKTYTYIHRIYRHQLKEGKVTFTLFEEGKPEPVERVTYYIDLN